MNYRHEFHAGNHTEVFKHAVLCLILRHLLKKATPFFVLDTHAGAGLYRLDSPEAQRTGEADSGIRKVYRDKSPILSTYLGIVRSLNESELLVYPGSPYIVSKLLRREDRLAACEIDRFPVSDLKGTFRGDRRIGVHKRSGYEAINALVPPMERRGLVFIDPPYEETNEITMLSEAMGGGLRKWPSGIFAAWYPIKNRSPAAVLRRLIAVENTPAFCSEFYPYPSGPNDTLRGGGLVIFNPPWRLDEDLHAVGNALVDAYCETRASFALEWWQGQS